MKWPLGLSTGIGYRHAIEETLQPIRRAGFEIIEVSTAPDHVDLWRSGSWPELARRIGSEGLRVHSLHAPFGREANITNPDAAARESTFDLLTRAADALVVLGGKLYVMHPGGEDQRWAWEREQNLALAASGLARMAELCRARGLTLVVETPLPHLLGGQLSDFAWLLERLPLEGVGVCVDTSHCSLGDSLYDALTRFGSRLVHVQVSDNRGSSDDHLPPGDGIIDWPHFRHALELVGYEGVFMLEITGNGDLSGHSRAAARAGARVLAP
jgi:sugar phosphate isomerase/epimerase